MEINSHNYDDDLEMTDPLIPSILKIKSVGYDISQEQLM